MRPCSSRTFPDAALALALALAPATAAACPCGASPSPTRALTAPADAWALSTGLSLVREVGSWDERARASATPADVRVDRAFADLAVAWRARPAWELSLATSASVARVDLPGVGLRERALGDTVARVRWEGNAPTRRGVPALAAWSGVRAPTGTTSTASALAGSLSGIGLGHWELSAGLELRWTPRDHDELVVSTEFGWRAPAQSGASTTQPGARALASASYAWGFGDDASVGVGAAAWFEAATAVDGQALPEGAVRRVTVTAFGALRVSDRTRVSATLSVDPWVDGLGANTPAALRAGLAVTTSR